MDIAGWEDLYASGKRGAEDQPTILLIETVKHFHHGKPGRAIDLACGTGRNSLYLAGQGWQVTALDGSASAIATLRDRSANRGCDMETSVADLTADTFFLPENAFHLVVIAYYLQRTLYPLVKTATRPGGLVLAIAHLPESGEAASEKRASPGELRSIFKDWEILHHYEGASRDPAHKRPVTEIVARRPPR